MSTGGKNSMDEEAVEHSPPDTYSDYIQFTQ